ncbi:MAG: PAS domain S-box protein [Bryobacterales bacterium]|nr:PAS domain S-box protein [Bryobacterales bacterium]
MLGRVRKGLSRRPALQYLLAVGLVVTAVAVRLLLAPILGIGVPYLLFVVPTIVTANLAGKAPALLAAVLGGAAADYFFMPSLITGFWHITIWTVVYLLVSATLVSVFSSEQQLRVRAEVALREVEKSAEVLRRQALLIDSSHDAIIIVDPQGTIAAWNGGASAMYGWTAAEACGSSVRTLFPNESSGSDPVLSEALYRDGRWEDELAHLTKDGRRLMVDSRQVLLRDEANRPVGILEINRDITGRKQAEEALRASEMRERARAAELEAVLEAVPAVTFVARDPECRHIIGSRATYDLLRMPLGSNLSKTPADGERPSHFKAMKGDLEVPFDELPMQKAASTGQPVRNYEFDFVFQDGSRRTMLGDAIPMLDEDGRTQGVVAAFLDITEHKRAEEGLRHAQKLESIGLLAGGIAHDFNNLLASIMGNASLLEADVEQGGREKVASILKASERAADLTRQLLAYAGRGRFIVQAVDVSETVRSLAELLYASVSKKVCLEQVLTSGLPCVEADPGQIQQIVMNLVLNAAEAIPENRPGMVTIRTAVEEITAERAVTDAVSGRPLAAGRYVCLEVRDTGVGMDERTQARIFDPFFTTKFTGRGLGLAAVGGIVKAHQGAIQVASSPGSGTTFRVLLPASSRPASRAAVPRFQDFCGSGTVLVVDDEEMLRTFVSAALARLGYTVLAAGDGQEAVEVFEAHAGRIDLVLLDLTMPVMNGRESWELLRERWPEARVILMSGHSESEAAELFPGGQFFSFLQKPFPLERLARHVKAALPG